MMMNGSYRIAVPALLLLCASCGGGEPADNMMNVDENLAVDMNAAQGPPAPARSKLVHCAVVERQVSDEDCEELGSIKKSVREGVAAFNVPSPMTRNRPKTITLVIDRRSPDVIAEIDAQAADNVAMNDTAAIDVDNAADNAVDDGADNAVDNPPPPPPPPPPPEAGGQDRPGKDDQAPTPKQVVEPMEGRTEQFKPLVGRLMHADLTGDGFKIRPLSELSQEVPDGEQRIWRWEVTPVEAGTHWLLLRTVVEGEAGGKRYQIAGTPTTRQVVVEVSWGDQLADAMDATVAWLNRVKLLLIALAGVLGAGWLVRRKLKGRGDDGGEEGGK